ncbi:TlpA disulfide reductase family protein [Terriglobus tenax]|uniref:TlpA disulfide reductase family protein n=1 Tax=Terriglobus tenax TaxID=1111115 RepID=UPI0021E0CC94|nr:TlpA disulfide reductase family protein [Terriglobus tenax]
MTKTLSRITVLAVLQCLALTATAQQADPKAIQKAISTLRQQPDDKRGAVTRDLALQVRTLPAGLEKLKLADTLSHLVTEGDPGKEALQAVTTTLAEALNENPLPAKDGKPANPYFDVARLVRYEGTTAEVSDPQFATALQTMKDNDAEAEKIDFTLGGFNLKDLGGKKVTLSQLRGKIILLNFWATWCPPCRKEMPDLQAIYDHFKSQGLVILSVSDEDSMKVAQYIGGAGFSYPILLDPGHKVATQYSVNGIPQTFVFNREGKLVARATDMRTQRQFLTMLAAAGLKPQ